MEDLGEVDSPIRVLLVEDASFVRESIVETLTRAGHEVIEAEGGKQALDYFADSAFDLILLDIVLPDTDGFQLCQTIRTQSDVPIVMLTALNHTDDILRGFEMGADDYITKPFSANELRSRICAVMRRMGGQDAKTRRSTLTIDAVTLDIGAGIATVLGQTVELSPIEANLLRYLMERPDRSVHKEELFKEVWGYELAGGTNLVEVAVRRLRTKIETDPSNPIYIITVHGFGYRFQGQTGDPTQADPTQADSTQADSTQTDSTQTDNSSS